MRPICLKMTAFGPFAATETVRFDQLGENPLFLINGPTGAGKSTILDAICYALYGETSANERLAREMRCDHASAETLTNIELVFQLADTSYRIKRIPEQERPKTRGAGRTVQKPSAAFYQQAADEEEILLVPSRVSEVNRAVIELTGLSAEQFRQVMVLPQGKFRELLLVDSEDREKVFRQLFQTQIYSRLESKLKEQANELSRGAKELRQQQQGILATVELEHIGALNATLAMLQKTVGELQQKRQLAAKLHTESIRVLSQSEQLEKQFTELDKAVKAQTELQQQQDSFKTKEQQKLSADQALVLHPFYAQLIRFREIAEEKNKALAQARVSADKAGNMAMQAAAAYQEATGKQPLLEQAKQQQKILESYRGRARQLVDTKAALERAVQELGSTRKLHEQCQGKLADKKAALLQFEQDRELLSLQSMRLPQVQSDIDKLGHIILRKQKYAQSARELQEKVTKLNVATDTLSRAENRLSVQSEECRKLQQAWQEGQAAIMAEQLVPGIECPVCGSTNHPMPAHSEKALPVESDLKAARECETNFRKARDTCLETVVSYESDIRQQQSWIDEIAVELEDDAETSVETLQDKLDVLLLTAKELQAAHNQLSEYRQTIPVMKQAADKAAVELETARERFALAERTLAVAGNDVSNKEAELPEKYRNPEQLEAEIEDAVKKIRDLEYKIDTARICCRQADIDKASADAELSAASEVGKNTLSDLVQAEVTWQSQLQQSVFEDEEAFFDALLEQDALETLTDSIAEYREALLSANISVEQRRESVTGKVRPDLAVLRLSENKRARAADLAEAAFHRSSEKEEQLKDAGKKLKEVMLKEQRLEQRYKIVGTLSDVANGNNAHNLSLQRFVLSVLLDDVLLSAGYRLNRMSKGRYKLLRKEGVGDKRSKSGLDLEVEDAYSGKRRPVATLSGGESFMAALSLALGLSEVIQSYAGGIRLDALFVDEGFGSLDPESLDLAINTLIDLQASGRMVGVVSHVPELKDRIDVRLDVLANRSGSRTKLVIP